MAQLPKQSKTKRQPNTKRLPLKHLEKKSINKVIKNRSRTFSLWFGPSSRLEFRVLPAKRLTKKQRQAKESRQKYLTFILIAGGIIGMVYFAVVMTAPVPSPPALVAPATHEATITPAPVVVDTVVASEPSQLRIPAVGIDTSLIQVGKNADNTLEVPSTYDQAGWYKLGPKPGESGTAVIVGHVSSKGGPAVFWDLSTTKKGDLIEVTGVDGKTVRFMITDVKQYPQDQFPTDEVYGQTKTPSLRVITCGGTYNKFTRRYTHNTVVFADIISQE